MLIFEQLRPFWGICQFCGLFPFHMKIDQTTKEFKRFSFSWKASLWFIFLILVQIIFFAADFRSSFRVYFEEGSGTIRSGLPPILVYFILCEQSTFFLLTIVVRLVVLRFSNLQRAFQLLQKVHNTLRVDDWLPDRIPRVDRRVNFSIFLSMTTVSQHTFSILCF